MDRIDTVDYRNPKAGFLGSADLDLIDDLVPLIHRERLFMDVKNGSHAVPHDGFVQLGRINLDDLILTL